jgi:hypothetical protein
VIASKNKATMKIGNIRNVVFVAMVAGFMFAAPIAIANDVLPAVPDDDSVSESTDANQVLEIPQQCGDETDTPCTAESTDDDASPQAESVAADPDSNPDDRAEDAADSPEVGSVDEYVNQAVPIEAAPSAPIYAAVPNNTELSPAPVVVTSSPMGPGFYQQWVAGPGFIQQPIRGPGFIQPMPFAFGGIRSFGRR